MFKKAALLLSGNAFGSLMLLVRNLVVARLVSVEDYGIAATFAISMAIVEMASGLGLQQLIVQDKKGEDPELQAGLQGFNVLRGLFSGAALFLLAHPIANFLGIPDVAWAYQLLALVPVIRGFEHFDIYRLNRSMEFGPLIVSKTLPALLSVLSVWPLYVIYGDYRVMLYSVMLHWLLTLATGQIMAKRRYQLRFTKSIMKKGFLFGWPLLINNIILFVVFQGDRLVIGRELGMAMLAIFSMGITLTLSPTLVMASTAQQFLLPQLSAKIEDAKAFARLANVALQVSLLNGLVLLLGIICFGPWLVELALGQKYDALQPLLIWFAIGQAIRVFKAGSSTVALSKAHTSNAMIANLLRISVLPIAWYLAANGATLELIIWVTILGEIFSYIASLTLLKRQVKHPLNRMWLPIGMMSLTLLLLALLPALWHTQEQPGFVPVLIILVMAPFCLWSMRDLRQYFYGFGVFSFDQRPTLVLPGFR